MEDEAKRTEELLGDLKDLRGELTILRSALSTLPHEKVGEYHTEFDKVTAELEGMDILGHTIDRIEDDISKPHRGK